MKSIKNAQIAFSHLDAFIWAMVGDFMREEAEALGASITVWQAIDDDDQVAGLANLIDQEMDAIIIAPVNSGHPGLLNQVTRAQAENISLLVIDSEIVGAESLPYLASDHAGGEAAITERLFDYLAGRARLAHIRGHPQLASHNLRAKGLEEVLQRYPGIEVVFKKHHDPSRSFEETGRILAREILAIHPMPQAIVATTDRIALGVVDVLKTAGLSGKIPLTGFDGIPHALRAIREGGMFGTVSQDVNGIAKRALAIVDALIQRNPVAGRTLLTPSIVTRDNVVDAALNALHYVPGVLDRVAEDNRARRRLQEELTGTLQVQKNLIATLQASEERFRSLTELSSDWYWEQDENFRFVSAGDAGEEGGFPTSVIGKTRWELPYLDITEEQWAAHGAVLEAHLPFRDFELKRIGKDGEHHHIVVSGQPFFDASGKCRGYRGVGKDITERRRSEERIQYLAYHDALTALPNRSFFTRQLSHSLVQAKRYQKRFAILFIDLDRFKNINDALGHEAGDRLLQEVARRLRGCLREGDTVARLGGDEFVVLLEELDDTNRAAVVAQKILSNIIQPVSLNDAEYQVTASIGISVYPDDGEDADEQTLMKSADIAMYLAKGKGKNNFAFYSAQASSQLFERLTMESHLRRAIQENEFLVHYQAKVAIASGQITGMEALVRWQHPQLGLVSPAQFIPLAEETGLIIPIGKWVLRTACLQNVEWQRRGMPKLRMAVNLSPRQLFDEHLIQNIDSILKETGMESDMLELEITESAVMYNADKALSLLKELKAMGIHLAIDDFGTGYSSLALLRSFPFDTLKIDQSFVKGLPGNKVDSELVNAIISMGKALSLRIVAEGVETKEQLRFLRERACDEMQGYYFSKPIPARDVQGLLETNMLKITAAKIKDA